MSVHTDAAPAGFIDLRIPGVERLATDPGRGIVDSLAECANATTRGMVDALDRPNGHARGTPVRIEAEDLSPVVTPPTTGQTRVGP